MVRDKKWKKNCYFYLELIWNSKINIKMSSFDLNFLLISQRRHSLALRSEDVRPKENKENKFVEVKTTVWNRMNNVYAGRGDNDRICMSIYEENHFLWYGSWTHFKF